MFPRWEHCQDCIPEQWTRLSPDCSSARSDPLRPARAEPRARTERQTSRAPVKSVALFRGRSSSWSGSIKKHAPKPPETLFGSKNSGNHRAWKRRSDAREPAAVSQILLRAGTSLTSDFFPTARRLWLGEKAILPRTTYVIRHQNVPNVLRFTLLQCNGRNNYSSVTICREYHEGMIK